MLLKHFADQVSERIIRETVRGRKSTDCGFQDPASAARLLLQGLPAVAKLLILCAVLRPAAQLQHPGSVEPSLHEIVGLVGEDGQAVAALRQEKADGRIRRPGPLQSPEGISSFKGVVDTQQQRNALRGLLL